MTIALTTVPTFLRETFPATRSILIGVTMSITPEPAISLPEVTAGSNRLLAVSAASGVKPTSRLTSKAVQLLLSLVIIGSVVVGAVLLVPTLYYRVFPADTVPVTALEEGTPWGGAFAEKAAESQATQQTRVLPPQDMTLPDGSWLIVPRIGIRTPLDPSLSVDEALAKGVWMAPEFGVPGDLTKPVILAAHRYGWKWWWQSDYWQYHSFYLLPELQPGDLIEVIDDHRKYTYEIYAGEEGEEITDYTADLIMYTCKYLSSPIRHFRYARIVDTDKNTQG